MDQNRRVEVVAHRTEWRKAYQEEVARLKDVWGSILLDAHHIGSTAIPGIKAKPILDILLVVTDLDESDMAAYNSGMQALGYHVLGEFGISGRRFFVKTNEKHERTHHVHVFPNGHPDIERHLVFRDYLLAHPEQAEKYSRLKEELARNHPEDIEAYMRGKRGFIEEVERKAMEWRNASMSVYRSIAEEYLRVIREDFEKTKAMGEKAIAQLSDSELHWTPNEESNSVAIIIKHLSGNMISRWTDFLESDGEKPGRDRDAEFVDDITNREEIMNQWEEGWQTVFSVIESLRPQDLNRTVRIRHEPHSVIEAIQRQIAHYAHHVGQIVYIAKQIKNNEWQTLSIARGKSAEFLQEMIKKHENEE